MGRLWKRSDGGFVASVSDYGNVIMPPEFCEAQGISTEEQAKANVTEHLRERRLTVTWEA